MQNHLEATRSIWNHLNIETSTLFWTSLPFSSIFPTWLEKTHSRFSILDPGSSLLDPGSSLLDSRFSILNSPFPILNSRSSIQDPRSSLPTYRFSILASIPDPRFSILESRYFSILYSRSSIFEPRFTVLDRHGGPSGSYTCKISWDFVRILENTACSQWCMAALVRRSPQPFIHFIPMPWAVLACVAILHTGGYYWNHLEPCFELLRFSWMCPTPSTWNVWLHWCAGPPPFSYILFPCSRVCWHALPFSLQLDTIGTHWNHHKPPETIWKLHYPGTSPTILLDVPIPSTWNVWLHWCAGRPPLSYILFPP